MSGQLSIQSVPDMIERDLSYRVHDQVLESAQQKAMAEARQRQLSQTIKLHKSKLGGKWQCRGKHMEGDLEVQCTAMISLSRDLCLACSLKAC